MKEQILAQTRKGLQAGLGLLLITIIFMILAPSYRQFDNFAGIFAQSAVLAIMALGTTIVLISGGLDLSVGSILALSAVVAGRVLSGGDPVWMAILAGVGAGALIGLINGFTVVATKVPPFIATMGMMMIARGLAEMLGRGRDMSYFPESFKMLGSGWVVPSLIAGLALVVTMFMLGKTKLGFHSFAIGGNEEVARLSGVPILRNKLIYYSIGGFLAGLAGVVEAARLNYVEPNYGIGWELQAIAGAVIGGTSLFGGMGGVGRTIIGVLIIRSLYAGLVQIGVDSYWQQVAIGAVIIIAVWIDTVNRKRAVEKA
ncbi:MAG: ABC transporter permease [Candidatus Marinimicrobia bacterium]|jgi:ribose/xylose/arabinose/galactoside ABC-type transport system permease subunit|nr:ABC transporter permease [Candidatus Neomarinimicrobiota bacterium]MBT3823627.1 ABC transporter permease [Candidatus Neomarinimicrobiota bacterium]MBT4129514.1 ABC transporter permease [Candidatus Neomarinimicrobiota bacterium]MBT4295960.1 ABC transporter permease [Candidatus Neomarinimicrobiota bacterium]MBT4420038.1 ABC transporter permease [Candidatus Neomarinimicrobiota bacterium]